MNIDTSAAGTGAGAVAPVPPRRKQVLTAAERKCIILRKQCRRMKRRLKRLQQRRHTVIKSDVPRQWAEEVLMAAAPVIRINDYIPMQQLPDGPIHFRR